MHRGWLGTGLGLMLVASVAAVVFDWPGVIAVLAALPGLLVLQAGNARELRRGGLGPDAEPPEPTWRELAIPFAPISVLCLAASYVFDTTRWAWLAPFMTLMVVGMGIAQHLAWRRAGAAGTS